MTGETTTYGRITIAPNAIATIASYAAMQSYGVVGMAAKNIVDGIAHILARDPSHGVDVKVSNGQLVIDVYVIIEFGTRISSVASSVANAVHYQVERAIGMPVTAVNVHVIDLRVSAPD
jgi:uncharacterized alkaline shock family protein YloU